LLASRTRGSDLAAWALAFALAIAAFTLLLRTYPDQLTGMAWRLLPYRETMRSGEVRWRPGGIAMTLAFTTTALVLSLVIGVVVGVSRTSPYWWLRLPAGLYVEVMRGIPLIVIIFATYYALSRPNNVFGVVLHFSAFWAAVAGLILCYGAYAGEIVRAGIESIPTEIVEAASLEGGTWTVARHVVVPQALRTTMPALCNEFVALLKDSALVSIVAIEEMTFVARNNATGNLYFFSSYALVGCVYLMITLVFSRLARILEDRWDVK